jgi:hypothetical protein
MSGILLVATVRILCTLPRILAYFDAPGGQDSISSGLII